MSRVAITGLNAGDSPAPGIPVIRCLREHPSWRGKIIGLGYDALESGVLDRRMVDSAYLIPYPSAGRESLLDRIRVIHHKEKLDVIIPNLDSELSNFIAIEGELRQMGIRLYLPSEDQLKQRSKTRLSEFCQKSGIMTPETKMISSPGDIDFSEERFPVVVKGSFYEAYVAYSPDVAAKRVASLAETWGYPILIQEYVQGEEFNAVAVGDGRGGVVGAALMKKLILTERGKGWACVSIDNQRLMNLAHAIVARLKWKGPIEIEAIQSQKNGEFYLIELNPRFPAWVYLAKASGVNLPHTLLQLAMGQDLDEPEQHRSGVVFSNYTTNLVMDLSSISSLFTNGELHHENVL